MNKIENLINHHQSKPGQKLPLLKSDLLLLHPPAVFDFRDREDIYFPFIGTSGDVPITPLCEYFPIGFKALQGSLSKAVYEVKIINLSTLFLRFPQLELSDVINAYDGRVVGISLHWMIHVQGSLEIAKLIKNIRPELRILLAVYHQPIICIN